MAKMYPSPPPLELRKEASRDAEWRLYQALESGLSAQYSAFYSVRWLSKARFAQDGEADFVIAHPERGALVVEVKGGSIAFSGATDTWTSTPRMGVVPIPIKDPVAQALKSKFSLADKVRELPGWSRRDFPFAHAVCFPHCQADRLDLSPNLPRAIIIDGPDLARISDRIDAIYRYWHGDSPGHTLGGEGMAMLHDLLSPSWQLGAPLSLRLDEADREIRDLSEQQFAVLRLLGRQRRAAVRGGAGTGKTVLAAEKARQLAAEGFRVLLTCYNRPLADHLGRLLGGQDNLEVLDFHQLCFVLAQRAGLPIDSAGPKSAAFFERELPEALLTALDRIPDRYDAIVVDEGQDFSDDYWIPLACTLRDPDAGIFYVFYDDNQDLFRPPSLPQGFPEPFALTENFRNTSQIHAIAKAFYRSPEEMVARGPVGEPVSFKTVEDAAGLNEIVESVLRRLIDGGLHPRNIAVLTGRGVGASQFAPLRSLGSVPLTRDEQKEPDRVMVETIFRFKGLERQVIVLTEIETLDPREDMAPFYVGLTRARLQLIVVGTKAAVGRLQDFARSHQTAVVR